MELVIHVTEAEEDLIYRLDPRTKQMLEEQMQKKGIQINIASKLHIGLETKSDYQHYHGDFEKSQVPIILTGLSPDRLKTIGYSEVVYYRTLTGKTDRVAL